MTALYRFDRFLLNPATRELLDDGVLVALPARAFDCLAWLIEHRDRAVGRDELIAAVWGRAEVSDALLSHTIVKIRRCLGDTGNQQRTVRTVPRFGYRWIGAIEVVPVEDAVPLAPAPASAPAPTRTPEAAPVPFESATVSTTAPVAASAPRPRQAAPTGGGTPRADTPSRLRWALRCTAGRPARRRAPNRPRPRQAKRWRCRRWCCRRKSMRPMTGAGCALA